MGTFLHSEQCVVAVVRPDADSFPFLIRTSEVAIRRGPEILDLAYTCNNVGSSGVVALSVRPWVLTCTYRRDVALVSLASSVHSRKLLRRRSWPCISSRKKRLTTRLLQCFGAGISDASPF